LAAGYEASFLVLAGNPLEDFENTRRIELLVKQGQPITLEPVDFPPFPSGR
jgi:imidazolonepropionase-like amidohydrolase